MAEKRTELEELGELGIIDRIHKNNPESVNESTLLGIGDDAAVVNSGDKTQVVTTDLLVEGTHFDLSYVPLIHLGYKSVAVNISDIAAMNAIPKQITVNIAVSNRFSVEAIDELYKGIYAACLEYKVDLIGGDTAASPAGLMISVTAIGEVEQDKVVKRSTAVEKDIVCVTGDLGGAYIGLQVLEREKQVFLSNSEMQPQLDNYDYIVQRQLKPVARMDIIHELREAKVVPSSMIDVSDGLASELLHLSNQSGVGFKIFEDKLPIDKQTYDTAVEFKLDPITCVMNGGEDYELLFTISQTDFEKVKNHPDIHFIGYADKVSEDVGLVTKAGNWNKISSQSWEHFKS